MKETIIQYIYQLNDFIKLKDDLVQIFVSPKAPAHLSYQAGEYLEILYPDTSYQPFSIANAPTKDGQIELHIRCLPQDIATAAMLKTLKETATITIQGPFGKAFYRKLPDNPIIILAAGTGFAYAKALVEKMIAEDDQRAIHLYWGVKVSADFYLVDLVTAWQNKLKNFHFTPVISKPHIDTQWTGKVGYIPQAVVNDYADLSQFQVYASGPFAMVKAAHEFLQAYGLRPDLMYSDMLWL